MSAWMNFIGKGYYTIPKFIAESQKHGITRRIALLPLMAMNWDDRVLCVQQEDKIQAHSAFIEFPITKLVGLIPEAIEAVSGLVTIKKVIDKPEEPEVERECGSYEQGAMYAIEEMPLCDVAKMLKKLKDEGLEIGKIMIGCAPEDITYIPEPYPRIKGLKHFRGFRAMNLEKFWNEVGEEDRKIREGEYVNRKNPTVSGTFYKKHIVEEVGEGLLQVVENYQKGDAVKVVTVGTEARVKKYEKQKSKVERLEARQARQSVIIANHDDKVEKALQQLSSKQLKRNGALRHLMDIDLELSFARDKVVELAPSEREYYEPELI